jgi:hypothetical protein
MDQEKLSEYLKTIPKPEPTSPQAQRILKITLLTARRSSRIGILLIALPGLVILLFMLQNLFHLDTGFIKWLTSNVSFMSNPARALVVFIFIVGFPLIAVVINLLSLCYFQYDRLSREFHITFKIRWWNIIITVIGGALASFYTVHLLADTLLGNG